MPEDLQASLTRLEDAYRRDVPLERRDAARAALVFFHDIPTQEVSRVRDLLSWLQGHGAPRDQAEAALRDALRRFLEARES